MAEQTDVFVLTDWRVLQTAWRDALHPRSSTVVVLDDAIDQIPASTAVLHIDQARDVVSWAPRLKAGRIVWLHPDITPAVALDAKRAGVTTLLHRSHGLDGLRSAIDNDDSALVRHLGAIERQPSGQLSMPQLSVLLLLSRGHTMHEAATRLGMSLSSVQRARRSALDALGVGSTSAAIARATELGLLVQVGDHTR